MVKWGALIAVVLLMVVGVSAQDVQEERDRNWLSIVVDSARIRALPLPDAEPAASRFEGDRLEAVGRNADGTWLQVVAPYGETPLGWISRGLVESEFEITLLPITDTITGVTGATPIVDTGVSVFITQNSRLRSDPSRAEEILEIVPHSVTVPAIARNPAGDWIQINYNGTVGWVARFLTRTVNDVTALPIFVSPRVGSLAPVRVIPREVQIAQINRLRAFVGSPLQASRDLGSQISGVAFGEIVPCTPASANFTHYTYTAEDVRQLPELGRFGPSINTAIDDLNAAIEMIGACGVYTEAVLVKATDLLPTGFFNSILFRLDSLEKAILEL